MPKYISYKQALEGVVSGEDVEALLGLVENVKNWGGVTARIPGHVVVRIIDELKTLKEQQLGFYSERAAVVESEEAGSED